VKSIVTALLVLSTHQIVAERVELRLQPKQDQAITYKVTSSARQVSEVNGQPVEVTTETSRSYSFALKAQHDDGSVDVALKYGPIRGTQTMPVGAMEFDSERPLPAGGLAAQLSKAMTIEAGVEVALKLSRESEILEAKGFAEQMKAKYDQLMPVAAQRANPLTSKLNDDHARRALVSIVPRLPKAAIAVGDEFRIEHGVHHCNEGKCTEIDPLAKVTAIDAKSVTIVIAGECPSLVPAGDVAKLTKFTVHGMTIQGTLVFSRVDGFLESMDIEEAFSAYQPSPAGVTPVTTTTRTRFERAS
jgi:hypothetical protein